jgi:hypothetical protein
VLSKIFPSIIKLWNSWWPSPLLERSPWWWHGSVIANSDAGIVVWRETIVIESGFGTMTCWTMSESVFFSNRESK